MELDLLHSLTDVGYNGALLDKQRFLQAVNTGSKSVEFTALISWLASEIGEYINIEESVNPTTSPDESSSFLLEMSAFLKELGCLNQSLMSGNVNQRLTNNQDRLNLIDFLITELMTAKILKSKEPQDKSLEISINESQTAKNLKEILIALNFQIPTEDIRAEILFRKISSKIQEVLKKVPLELISKPLFYGILSNQDWEQLNHLQHDLREEYKIRREMLLKRLDVTIISFSWSDRLKSKEDQLNKIFYHERSKLKVEPNVSMADLLAARDDLAILEKTSNAQVRKNTKSQVNTVIIGNVPDRGGRPYEVEPPPPEMPPWQKEHQASQTSRGGFGNNRRGGQGRGGYQRGGYNDRKDTSTNFGQNFGGHSSTGSAGYTRGGGHASTPGPIGVFLSSNYNEQTNNFPTDNRERHYNDNRRGGGSSSQSIYSGSGYQGDQRSHKQGEYHNQQNSYSNNNRGYQRGGRVQGGWNQGGSRNQNSNYSNRGNSTRGNNY